jgi:site-specific DNA-methyltransferase (adenine-specific)
MTNVQKLAEISVEITGYKDKHKFERNGIKSTVYLMDCIEGMKRYPDKYFDLAIVDPPYGIGASEMQMGNNAKKKWSKGKNWDNETPTAEYWTELFRVSKNQIVWGGNYFDLPLTKSWIIWDKNNGESGFADGEMAWTSFKKPMRIRKIHWTGSASNWEDTNGKIHPTQKPLKLYDWLLKEFAEEGNLILDTHLGSGSSRIAAYKAGLDFVSFEIDPEYFDKSVKRFEDFTSQLNLF